MFNQLKRISFIGLLAGSLIPSALAADFTQAQLEKMVLELEAVAVHNPAYKWPIKCSIVKDDKKVNAYASYEEPKGGAKPQAIMVLFTGLVEAAKGDERLIRAVIAHEVSHLACGHVTNSVFKARDLQFMMTRQQEHEADIVGAQLLQKSGHSKQDMVDMLLFLDGLRKRKGDWLHSVNADHATPKARAAEVASDPAVLRALVQFDVGLAYMESRKYNLSAQMFELAIAMEPKLVEAYTNRAQAKLLSYWEGLPGEFVARSFRPDFGPFILTPQVTGKGIAITAQNREQYKEAMDAIDLAIEKSGAPRDRELKALAQILNPDADKDQIQAGIDGIGALKPVDDEQKFRFANNVAVAKIALGKVNEGLKALLDEWKSNSLGNFSAAENLGRIRLVKGQNAKDDVKVIRDVLKVWLANSPKKAPAYAVVYEGYKLACDELGEKPEAVEETATFLLPAISITHKGKETGLFTGLDAMVNAYGKASLLVRLSEKYQDLFLLKWGAGEFTIMSERGKALRVTSYEAGDSLSIKAEDPTVREDYAITVGMSVDALKQWLNVDAGKPRDLVGLTGNETWTFFSGLNFGVLIKDDKVAGITITGIAEYDDD